MTTSQQFCTFTLDRYFFGVEVHRVQEVIRYQDMTRVPIAPAEVSGLINLRGQIVTALDLRRRLGLAPRPEGTLPMNVVARTEEGVVSFLVDEIGDVLEVSPDLLERPPENLDRSVHGLLTGVYKLEGRLLLILDSERAAEVSAAPSRTNRSGALQ
jgi:purine-binding chemotaxis protein CheW